MYRLELFLWQEQDRVQHCKGLDPQLKENLVQGVVLGRNDIQSVRLGLKEWFVPELGYLAGYTGTGAGMGAKQSLAVEVVEEHWGAFSETPQWPRGHSVGR